LLPWMTSLCAPFFWKPPFHPMRVIERLPVAPSLFPQSFLFVGSPLLFPRRPRKPPRVCFFRTLTPFSRSPSIAPSHFFCQPVDWPNTFFFLGVVFHPTRKVFFFLSKPSLHECDRIDPPFPGRLRFYFLPPSPSLGSGVILNRYQSPLSTPPGLPSSPLLQPFSLVVPHIAGIRSPLAFCTNHNLSPLICLWPLFLVIWAFFFLQIYSPFLSFFSVSLVLR